MSLQAWFEGRPYSFRSDQVMHKFATHPDWTEAKWEALEQMVGSLNRPNLNMSRLSFDIAVIIRTM